MLVQWTSKLCPFTYKKYIFGVQVPVYFSVFVPFFYPYVQSNRFEIIAFHHTPPPPPKKRAGGGEKKKYTYTILIPFLYHLVSECFK